MPAAPSATYCPHRDRSLTNIGCRFRGFLDFAGRRWSSQGMKIHRIAPILTVNDLATAIAEHTDVLGMQVVMNIGWVAFLADESGRQIGLMTTDASARVNPEVSVFVDDVDAAHRAAVAAGLEITHPLTTEDWGVYRFFYRDASGRVINVGMHV